MTARHVTREHGLGRQAARGMAGEFGGLTFSGCAFLCRFLFVNQSIQCTWIHTGSNAGGKKGRQKGKDSGELIGLPMSHTCSLMLGNSGRPQGMGVISTRKKGSERGEERGREYAANKAGISQQIRQGYSMHTEHESSRKNECNAHGRTQEKGKGRGRKKGSREKASAQGN